MPRIVAALSLDIPELRHALSNSELRNRNVLGTQRTSLGESIPGGVLLVRVVSHNQPYLR